MTAVNPLLARLVAAPQALRSLWASALCLAALAASTGTQQGRPPAPPLEDVPQKLAPGLTVTFESAGGATDARHARMVALYVPRGTPPTPFLPSGPFRATYEGFVSVDLGTDCTFSAAASGTLSVTVNGKPALEAKGSDFPAVEGKPVRLKKGRNALVVRYESPEKGDAVLRLSWTSSDFPTEPVGALVTSHDANAKALRAQRRLREGRELFAARRCLKCHLGDFKGMPELEMDAPSLAEAGARLHPAWMEKWIRGPRTLRPEATMPHFAGMAPQDAADIATFLATLGRPAEEKPPAADAAKAGGHLFAEIRCVGCHTLPEKGPAPDRIPLNSVKAKWRPAALRAFLLGPEKHYAWIEMPNFHLTEQEAAKLAAFLLSRPGQEIASSGLAGDPARGRRKVENLGCANCHTVPVTNAFKAPALKDIPADGWTRGCMAPKNPAKAPDFGLTDAQRASIVAFAATDLSSLAREAPPEFLERQIAALRCQACHKRDDRHDYWFDLQGETKDLLPPKKEENPDIVEVAPGEPVIPSLSWTGEKLKPEWTAAFLKGEIPERPRPYLGLLRMPAFASRAAMLARGFALEHGGPPAGADEPEPSPPLAEIGRKLSGSNGGLDCLQCHGIGPKAATKVFEAPGPNFKDVRARLRKDYFDRWVRAPLRLEPGTKMPTFFENNQTKLTEILDGDANRQIEALWHYLLEGEKIRPPTE